MQLQIILKSNMQKSIKIQINKRIKFVLLYNKNSSLEKKIKIEQLIKETKNN